MINNTEAGKSYVPWHDSESLFKGAIDDYREIQHPGLFKRSLAANEALPVITSEEADAIVGESLREHADDMAQAIDEMAQSGAPAKNEDSTRVSADRIPDLAKAVRPLIRKTVNR